jgi:hypothetical protein
MGDYIAIRYHLKIKPAHKQSVADANNRKEGADIISWNAARLKFDNPADAKLWKEFLDHPISLAWPDSDLMHFNPQDWPLITRYYSWLTGMMKGTQCMKVIPGGIDILTRILPLIADEWKVEIDIRDILFDPHSGAQEFVDVYTNHGNDLYADRNKKYMAERNECGYGFPAN